MTEQQHLILDGYIRVSDTHERVEGVDEDFIGPKIQRERIEAWAKSRGVTIAKWHDDMDKTGGKLERPGLDALMERIRGGQTAGSRSPAWTGCQGRTCRRRWS